MKILLLNYRYFVSGGPERYMFGVKELLERRGHEVVPFSFRYAANEDTPHAEHFAEPPGGEESAFYADQRLSPLRKLRVLGKALYNREAKQRVREVIERERVDVAYALQIVSTLYPSVLDACEEAGVPVVYRLSDFQFLCANYKFFRDGRICEDCIGGKHYRALLHRCLKGSVTVSAARALALHVDRYRRTRERVSAFVTPTEILRRKMIEGGFPEAKLVHLPTFVDTGSIERSEEPGEYFLYVGAIAEHKGVRTLLDAYARLPRETRPRLVIAGRAHGTEQERLEAEVRRLELDSVEFPGFLRGAELDALFRRARAVVVPPLWHENMPNALLEGMAYGRAIVGSDRGGVREVLTDSVDGLLFAAGDAGQLADRLQRLVEDDELVRTLGRAARETAEHNHAPERHVDRLLALFDEVTGALRPPTPPLAAELPARAARARATR